MSNAVRCVSRQSRHLDVGNDVFRKTNDRVNHIKTNTETSFCFLRISRQNFSVRLLSENTRLCHKYLEYSVHWHRRIEDKTIAFFIKQINLHLDIKKPLNTFKKIKIKNKNNKNKLSR